MNNFAPPFRLETISSRLTAFFKFVFPVLWIGTFGARALEYRQGAVDGNAVVIWLIAGVAIYFYCIPLKRVHLKDRRLIISNYFDEIRVPFDEIATVGQSRWIQLQPIRITFKCPTRFGSSILLIPSGALWRVGEHQVVERLRRLSRIPKDKG